jgi:chitin-binding protein
VITLRKAAITAAMTTAIVLGTTVGGAIPAQAHGYVSAPYSRALACKMGLNTNCGNIVFEPQSLEAPKGYPQAGPVDGKIASAGGAFPQLDQQTFGRWYKNEISPGPLRIDWTYTAPHSTAQWRYYITKQSWDPSGPLERNDFELISTIAHNGTAASNNKVHTISIPANRSGYHVVLAVWDVADTANAFYNVIDVNITGTGAPADTQPPTVPTNVHSMGETSSSVDVMWGTSTDNVGVTGYVVFRNGVEIARPTAARFMDMGLAANTSYTYTVRAVDAAGNTSAPSAPFTATTKAATPVADTTAPSAPSNVHSMGETSSSVDVMWGASTDNVGVTGYVVFRNGVEIARPTSARFMDMGLAANTSYTYTVRARDAAGNVSAASAPFTVTTKAVTPAPTPTPTPTPTVAPAGQWSSTARYAVGDRVTFNGVTYVCIQAYQGWGDPNWINAPSLWKAV